MTHHVVLDADWFVINKIRYFKKVAYFAPSLGLFGELSFSLPPGAAVHRQDLIQQTKSSHGLDWRKPGKYRHDEVDKAFLEMVSRLRHQSLEFLAKGSEK